MREIKFKIWTGSIMMQPKSLLIMHQETVNGVTVGHWEKLIYLQYTGRKDKNGKEAYYHDIILKNGKQKFVIEYDESIASFCYSNVLKYPFTEMKNDDYFEIIGNIYENPELRD